MTASFTFDRRDIYLAPNGLARSCCSLLLLHACAC
jgi:hypothetical protein